MSGPQERLRTIRKHLEHDGSDTRTSSPAKNTPTIPIKRHELLKWNGWGYKDSRFEVDPSTFMFSFTGNRYEIGNKNLPLFRSWTEKTLSIDLTQRMPAQDEICSKDIPSPIICKEFMEQFESIQPVILHSLDPDDRLFRSHGHTLHEIVTLRNGSFKRIPDLVIWPKSGDQVESIVRLADEKNVVIIPYGGGTSVSGALECPRNETRMIVSLDLSQMNRCLFINHRNLTARFEAGIVGQDLERHLSEFGLCVGHEPDSFEFSSLGGWVATKASGMKKNIYGNIEDILVHVKMVTTRGVLERGCEVPRIAAGPDIHHFILGSEGTLGVITEVTLKVRPLPQVKKYNSLVFPDFESGVNLMREVAKRRLRPASIRLMDNQQFLFGQALKPQPDSLIASIMDSFKKIYLSLVKGLDLSEICVATLLFEGNAAEVEQLEEQVLELAKSFNGICAGEENGKRGYMLTFVIAYIRDLGLDYGAVAESFETSVPWDRCIDVCRNVKERVAMEGRNRHLTKPILITCRVTQTYDAGACVYFYFAFNYQNGFSVEAKETDPVRVYEAIERAARDEILASGGSLSHHHGVGKVRRHWLQDTISPVGVGIFKAVKSYLDPSNIFANGNLVDPTDC